MSVPGALWQTARMGVVANAVQPQLPPRISAAGLRRALIAGARSVILRRELLDRINVFPVPDGDTGTNLAFTLSSVLRGALARRAGGAGELLRAVADDALDGARGNSGAILAQFLHGVADETAGHHDLSMQLLARAVRAGAEQARAALSEPREGTILSVIGAFARALELPSADLHAWFTRALQHAESALRDTPRQLPVLRQAGVVDAGGQGFVDLLSGIAGFLASGRVPVPVAEAMTDCLPAVEPVDAGADPAHRWCSECLVEGDRVDRTGLRAAIAALGASSVVIAGGDARVRVHAHVAAPARLFECIGRFGRVGARKADDMLAQQRAVANRAQVAVLTDSGADLPDALADAVGLGVVPVRVTIGSEDFLDKVTLTPAELYARVRAGGELPRTSQPPPGDFRRRFELLLAQHPALVYSGVSRAVSGTLQSAESAAARVDGARAHVLDSGHVSCGQGLVALALAEAAAAGAGVGELQALNSELRARTDMWACARDIRHAVRGGRLPRWVAPLARWLPLVPIARMGADGRLRVRRALVGHGAIPLRFARHVAAQVPAGARVRVMVGHCGCALDGHAVLDVLRTLLDCEDAWLVEAGPAVGAHAGPDTLVVGIQRRD